MNDDLAELLKESSGAADTTIAANEIGGTPAIHKSETAFTMDKWARRRAEQVNAEWQEQEIDPINDVSVLADAHEALFNPSPVLADQCEDAKRQAWFKQLTETPEYKALHNQTMLDSDLSAIASREVCNQFVEYAAQEPPEQKENQEGVPGTPGGTGGEESIQDTINRIRSTGKAVQKAKQDVQDAKDFQQGIGAGEDSQIDRASLSAAFKRVRNSDFLRKVMQTAGRFRARCASLQKSKIDSKHGEIVGIELSGDLSRLIPSERLALASDDLVARERAEFRLLRRRSLSYKHKLATPVVAGPIVICIDESGSMSGSRIIAAKALALTMAWLATQQNRWCALVAFSGDAQGRVLALPPRHRLQADLISWIEAFMNGGTVLDCPCDTMPQVYWPQFLAAGMPRGKTDHIVITDGALDCSDALQTSYKSFCKTEQVKTYGIVVGCHDTGEIGKVCDKLWCIDDLSLDSSAVESILSI